MPLYIFSCPNDHRQELFYKIADKPDALQCHVCGEVAKQIPAIGGIETDSPVWLNDEVRGALQDSDMLRQGRIRPLETRKELHAFLKRNNLVCVG